MEGVPDDHIVMLQELYKDAKYVVAVNGVLTEAFDSRLGLLQGCPLSPILYSLYLKRLIIRILQACSLWGIRIGASNLCLVNFADDITTLLMGIAFVEYFLRAVQEILKARNQLLCRSKCKVLISKGSHCSSNPKSFYHSPQ